MTVRRGGVPQMLRKAHQYLSFRAQAANLDKVKDPLGKELKAHIAQSGELDANGNVDLLFPEPLTIDGETFLGLRNQKIQPAPLVDEEKVDELLATLPPEIRERVVREVTITVRDDDELYVLNQEGLITDDQLDGVMFTPEPRYSLVVIK